MNKANRIKILKMMVRLFWKISKLLVFIVLLFVFCNNTAIIVNHKGFIVIFIIGFGERDVIYTSIINIPLE